MDKALMVLEARNILRTLEWSAKYSSCTGWPCCPICNGIKPGHGRNRLGELPDNQGHFKSCKLAKVLLKFGETERELNNERMSLNEDFNKESFKMLAWHRFVLWQQIIQSEPKRIRDSGGVQSVLMDIVEQQQKEWDELKNKYV